MYNYIQQFNDQLNLVIQLNPDFPKLDVLESLSNSTQFLLKHRRTCSDFIAHAEMLIDFAVFFIDNRCSLRGAEQLLETLDLMAVFLTQKEEILNQIRGL